ncbi:hypothetical protein OG215_15320 [Streptomyces globisporus]|uniref:hypothetical protein n=1 Tax=Streptomyces globisporus TaxID=1908 RepID=UPI003870A6D5|nr:hypothetical protein OG215_15320 [Streptomyces globisporus]
MDSATSISTAPARCPECGDSLADYPDGELVFWRQDPRPFCSVDCVIDHDARRNAANVHRRAQAATRQGDQT